MTGRSKTRAGERVQLWGGVECTINRVGDQYFSQLEKNGHDSRLDDLDRCAALGIRAMRYPVLWERTAPSGLEQIDWSWPDQRLQRLRDLDVAAIVGLVHHGSGPRYTSLVDPEFPEKLAAYAAAVARRFPWVDQYTPVNEPLTTARFSGLYGLWYPHGRDERTFKDALLTQCRGIVLAMEAIRHVNPAAKLIQTEDLGKTYSTPPLAYQAQFNNDLRWLAWDLLSGRVDSAHPLWNWLIDCCAATERELLWFVERPCAPDVIGVNHYITSERFLDERLENFPMRFQGGNGVDCYVDIEAARCLATPTRGIKPLLHEVWERYRSPIAITEAHIDSTRDDQMRWLAEVWAAASEAKLEGVDVQAVTVWALLGSYDWNCLLTECRGYYEPGAFDVRGPRPRPTAIARLMQDLAQGRVPNHPVLSGPGWWKRPERFFSTPVELTQSCTGPFCLSTASTNMAPILLTGATGTLGRAFARMCQERGLNYRLLSRKQMDIADEASIERALADYEPWAIINAAGYVRVDDAEKDVERCFRENALGPYTLATICAKHALPLVTFSTDFVFDGNQHAPYVEADTIAPLNVYGRSKALAETRVLARHPEALVIRTSSFFGPWDDYNYITVALRTLRRGEAFTAANDLTVSPTYVPDLVNVTLDLLIDREKGIWHLTNGYAITWADLALRAAELARVDASRLQSCCSDELKLIAKRPSYSALGSSRSLLMPTLDNALSRYFSHQPC